MNHENGSTEGHDFPLMRSFNELREKSMTYAPHIITVYVSSFCMRFEHVCTEH